VRVAGLISGTSVDGIDVAIVDFGQPLRVTGYGAVPYPDAVRRAVLAISNTGTHTAQISRMNFLLGELFSEALKTVCKQNRIALNSIELIGSHGQTIFHEGEPADVCGRRIASTLQIGEPAVIAQRTGIPVIADFRTADMAAGGKGAPLVPFVDWRLFCHGTIARVALNIGGIANITVIPAAAPLEQVVAFDTGPGNMVIDALVPPFDRDGAAASRGRVNETLLRAILADPYYRAPPPKTAGREQYGPDFHARWKDLDPTTATELTARTIAMAIEGYPATREVIVSGGGAHNAYLMKRLRSLIAAEIKPSSDYCIDTDAKEAIAFAVLAHESFHGRPSNVPSATGAKKPVVLGKRVEP